MKAIAAAAAAGVLLSGCATDLKVTKVNPSGTRSGIGYALPFTQFTNDISWQVASCDTKQADGSKLDELKVSVKINVTAGKADDGKHAYVIDPTSIQTLVSVASLKVDFQDNSNLIDSINESVEDQTGQFIVNVATGAAKLALAGLGLPVPRPGAAPSPPSVPRCNAATRQAVAAAKALAASLDALNDQISDATDDVNRLSKKAIAMGGAVDEKTKIDLGNAIDHLNSLTANQADLTSQLTEAVKPISYKVRAMWPQDSDVFTSYDPKTPTGSPFINGAVQLPAEILKKWTEPPGAAVVENGRVYFSLERLGSFGRDLSHPTSYVEPPTSAAGLRYWMAAQGRLTACSANPCASSDTAHVLVMLDGPVVQLGFINVLPIHTRAFGSTAFAAGFAPTGALKSAGYDQKSAPAVAASSSFSSVADQVAPLIAANQPTAKLARETAKLEALKKQRDALAGLGDDPNAAMKTQTAALETDTALINAQIANYEARASLAVAEAAAGANK